MTICAMVIALQLVATDPKASSDDDTSSTPAQLRTSVHETLRRHATSKGPERISAARELIALHQQIGLNQQMNPRARRQLQGLVGARLQRAAQDDDYGPDLLELIERTVAPGTWESQGGRGRIYYWRNGRAMVISQTQEAHEELADLMEQLHRAGN